MSSQRTALVIVLSEARNDPRVRRQITWLAEAGWAVDTIGLGATPSAEVRDHFALGEQAAWVRSKLGNLIVYGVLPKRSMFRRLAVDRIPPEALSRIAEGSYDLIVFDDSDYIPLVKDRKVFTRPSRRTHVHLDLHEYHEAKRKFTPWRALTSRFYNWQRTLIGDSRFDSRSTVATQIASFYAQEFDIEPPVLVRNSPPFKQLDPSPAATDSVKLVFHGLASWGRGFEEILEALRLLDDRFTMTFMLTGNPGNVRRLADAAADLGNRVQIVPPVPMSEVPEALNQHDLEVMFYPPTHRNVEFALPNKFFEAVQGRLGLVVGESPMMAELVRSYSMGSVVGGWTGADLADTLRRLTQADIAEFKLNAHRAAGVLNAEVEGKTFLTAVTRKPLAD